MVPAQQSAKAGVPFRHGTQHAKVKLCRWFLGEDRCDLSFAFEFALLGLSVATLTSHSGQVAVLPDGIA